MLSRSRIFPTPPFSDLDIWVENFLENTQKFSDGGTWSYNWSPWSYDSKEEFHNFISASNADFLKYMLLQTSPHSNTSFILHCCTMTHFRSAVSFLAIFHYNQRYSTNISSNHPSRRNQFTKYIGAHFPDYHEFKMCLHIRVLFTQVLFLLPLWLCQDGENKTNVCAIRSDFIYTKYIFNICLSVNPLWHTKWRQSWNFSLSTLKPFTVLCRLQYLWLGIVVVSIIACKQRWKTCLPNNKTQKTISSI
jgi:hypothetical protein